MNEKNNLEAELSLLKGHMLGLLVILSGVVDALMSNSTLTQDQIETVWQQSDIRVQYICRGLAEGMDTDEATAIGTWAQRMILRFAQSILAKY